MEQVPLQKNALKHEGFAEEEQMPKCCTHLHQPRQKEKMYRGELQLWKVFIFGGARIKEAQSNKKCCKLVR